MGIALLLVISLKIVKGFITTISDGNAPSITFIVSPALSRVGGSLPPLPTGTYTSTQIHSYPAAVRQMFHPSPVRDPLWYDFLLTRKRMKQGLRVFQTLVHRALFYNEGNQFQRIAQHEQA